MRKLNHSQLAIARMTKMKTDLEVDAIFITDYGFWFEHKASHPHENFLTLQWELDDGEDVTIEFVYFGHHNNRVVYHAIKIEEYSLLS
jgi:hypothetical protein